MVLTRTFAFSHDNEGFTVPSGVTEVYVDASGASGGFSANENNSHVVAGGQGAEIKGLLAVTPGQQLLITVGGHGAPGLNADAGAGGWQYGGDAGQPDAGDGTPGGGGGGATTVATGTGRNYLIAGGGGGAGGGNSFFSCSEYGGAGGNAGTPAPAGAGQAGQPGSGCVGPTDHVGGGGAGGVETSNQGADGQQAQSQTSGAGGGGGGGGLSGGAGGGASVGALPGGGGGGGTSWYDQDSMSDVTVGTAATTGPNGDGQVTIIWGVPSGTQAAQFNYMGNVQRFTVPAGVTNVVADVVGAQGGEGDGAPFGVNSGLNPVPGGGGDEVEQNLAVTPGEVLTIFVGGEGGSALARYKAQPSGGWGFGNGGTGGIGSPGTLQPSAFYFGSSGAGGGGGTAITNGQIPLIVSGGGGGAGGFVLQRATWWDGGGGGSGGGGDGQRSNPQWAAGGEAGASSNPDGLAGSNGKHGAGGGGGGGGYLNSPRFPGEGGGGGGGSSDGGAGGGAGGISLTAPFPINYQRIHAGNGEVLLVWGQNPGAVLPGQTGARPPARGGVAPPPPGTVRFPAGRLRLKMKASRRDVRVGRALFFTVSVSNASFEAIRGIKVCDALPRGLRLVTSTTRTRRKGRRYCWTITGLADHTTRRFTLTARATRRGPATSAAIASATGARPAHAAITIHIRSAPARRRSRAHRGRIAPPVIRL